MSRVYGEIVTLCDDVDETLDVTEVDARVYTLRIQIQSKVYKVNVACALAVPEQATFDAVGTG
jgi:hypothetical protein